MVAMRPAYWSLITSAIAVAVSSPASYAVINLPIYTYIPYTNYIKILKSYLYQPRELEFLYINTSKTADGVIALAQWNGFLLIGVREIPKQLRSPRPIYSKGYCPTILSGYLGCLLVTLTRPCIPSRQLPSFPMIYLLQTRYCRLERYYLGSWLLG